MRRLIFTLLYDSGHFMLSRNFRLQKVGSIDWLFKNYHFESVSRGLDELMVLDVSRGNRDSEAFADKVRHIAGQCFIPMTVGGGIASLDIARLYMRSGADKLLLNSAFLDRPDLCRSLAEHFGRQCIVAGIDYRLESQRRRVMVGQGTRAAPTDLSGWVEHVQELGAGELLLQSMDKDGTGMGQDLGVIAELRRPPEAPCILMGGVGKAEHIIAGLLQPEVDAIATANLFNFIGSAFLDVRKAIGAAGIGMAHWNDDEYSVLRGKFANA